MYKSSTQSRVLCPMKQSKKITIYYTTHCDDQYFYCRVHIAHYFSEGKQLKINGSPSELNRQGRDRRERPIGNVAIYSAAPPSIFICNKRTRMVDGQLQITPSYK